MTKNLLRMLGCWLLAEVLTLFLDLTLAFSASIPVRIICMVCTIGVLLAVMVQGGLSAAKDDKRSKRQTGFGVQMLLGLFGSLAPLLWTGVLVAARNGLVADDFYRWYKLLCAPFLTLCNLLSEDVVASALPSFALPVLFAVSLLPCVAAVIAYRFAQKNASIEDMQY